MKLSTAMMLGAAQMPQNDGVSWFGTNYPKYDNCGCAIGRAWFAAGQTADDWHSGCSFCNVWPWLWMKGDTLGHVSILFMEHLRGQRTFESIVDYVRSIEPECGECNRFDCTCAKEPQPEDRLVCEARR